MGREQVQDPLMPRAPARTAFVNATVLPFDDKWRVLEGCDVVVANGHILAMGTNAVAQRTVERRIDATHLVITPGFVNAHTHSPENLARGLADGLELHEWLGTVWRSLDRLDADGIRLAAQLGCIEMIRSGTVAVVDHFRQYPPRLDAIDAVARAYQDAGLKALVAVWLRDALGPRNRANSAPRQVEICAEAARRWHKPEHGLRIGVGPSGPTRCTDELLSGAGALAREAGLSFHIHVDETREEAGEARKRYGSTAIRHLRDLDLVWPGLSVAHGVWLTDADIRLLAGGGAGIVHNPISNMRLGSGIARLDAMRDAGMLVALGTDGAASNDSQNILEAAKAAAFLQRLSVKDRRRWPSMLDALAMLTHAPATMFGLTTGMLQAGGPADFVAFDRRSVGLAPGNDLHRQIVLCHTALTARFSMIAGRLVLDDGHLTTIDEAAVLREAAARRKTRGRHARKH
jgi:5-methylthioadenosine/S-adenosylhomocysteine deaminase